MNIALFFFVYYFFVGTIEIIVLLKTFQKKSTLQRLVCIFALFCQILNVFDFLCW